LILKTIFSSYDEIFFNTRFKGNFFLDIYSILFIFARINIIYTTHKTSYFFIFEILMKKVKEIKNFFTKKNVYPHFIFVNLNNKKTSNASK